MALLYLVSEKIPLLFLGSFGQSSNAMVEPLISSMEDEVGTLNLTCMVCKVL